jgi:dTDP-4-dehydrorhamnose reductase
MLNTERTLIVGGNSSIGKYIRAHSQWEVFYTSRKSGADIYCDLTDISSFQNIYNAIKVNNIKSVILLAAVTTIDACKKSPKETYRLNVDHTCLLLEQLNKLNCFCIFLSTNHIFDCEKPYIEANTPSKPLSEYGRQKFAVECYITEKKLNVAIIRPTKVVTLPFQIVTRMFESLSLNQTFNAFDDHFFAPITVEFLTKKIEQLIKLKRSGTYQLSGKTDVSYYQFLKLIAKEAGYSSQQITPINASSMSVCACKFGSLAPLWPEKLEDATQSIEDVIRFITHKHKIETHEAL